MVGRTHLLLVLRKSECKQKEFLDTTNQNRIGTVDMASDLPRTVLIYTCSGHPKDS